MNLPFRSETAAVILLPEGSQGEDILSLVEEWSKSWLLQPAYWLKPSNIQPGNGKPPEILATVVGRNGMRDIDLFQQISRYPVKTLRLISIRTVEESSDREERQKDLLRVLSKYVKESKPQNKRIGQQEVGTNLIKINLIFSPSEADGGSYPILHDSHWNFNIVVSPEDRALPDGFDSFTSSANKKKQTGFILSNTATAAAIWTGQTTSVYEEEQKYTHSSVHFNKVLVQRTFVRAVVSEALAFRVAAHTLNNLLMPANDSIESKDQTLKFFSVEETEKEITELVDKVMDLSTKALDYESPEELLLFREPKKTKISILERLSLFSRFVIGIFVNLPIWIFTAISQGLSNIISRKIDSEDGEYEIDSTLDFPRTKLDKLTEADIVNLQKNRDQAERSVEEWKRPLLRKAPPQLFSEFRNSILNRLDNTSCADGSDKIFSDPSDVIPDFNSVWQFTRLEDFGAAEKLFKDDEFASNLLHKEIRWTDQKDIHSGIKNLEGLIKDLSNRLRRENAEIETLESELEILTKKMESNEISLRMSIMREPLGVKND